MCEPQPILIDGLQYKATYENVILVGSGTYGSVYYVRCDGDGDIVNKKVNFVGSGTLKVATMWRPGVKLISTNVEFQFLVGENF